MTSRPSPRRPISRLDCLVGPLVRCRPRSDRRRFPLDSRVRNRSTSRRFRGSTAEAARSHPKKRRPRAGYFPIQATRWQCGMQDSFVRAGCGTFLGDKPSRRRRAKARKLRAGSTTSVSAAVPPEVVSNPASSDCSAYRANGAGNLSPPASTATATLGIAQKERRGKVPSKLPAFLAAPFKAWLPKT